MDVYLARAEQEDYPDTLIGVFSALDAAKAAAADYVTNDSGWSPLAHVDRLPLDEKAPQSPDYDWRRLYVSRSYRSEPGGEEYPNGEFKIVWAEADPE